MKHHSIYKTKLSLVLTSTFWLTLLLIAVFAMALGVQQRKADALTTQDFNAGRIIDDTVFYNKNAMTVQQIQAFLNKLIPSCDTWGTGPSEYGGGTRAQYAASVGWPGPPYACLNNYHENPQTKETSYERGGGAFDGGTSAAQIIYDAAQQYGINPQVLLVLIKKESPGPLTADSWPLKAQYKYTMGYACPDSGPGYSANCDTEKAGFYKQVMLAAWQLKYYKEHPNDYRYKIGSNSIQYSPDPTCGTKNVHIENIATLSLYIYTPYTPNDAALANYPGTAHCGAYGNRNFFMYFKEWFGSPNYRPPTCDAVASDVSCVWKLYSPDNMSEFLTTSSQERDIAVTQSGYSYENIAFYAFTTQRPGTIPVYRIRLPDRHFYTASESEKNNLIQNGQNQYEGVAFYTHPTSASTNASHIAHRLYGSRGQILTGSASEKSVLIEDGYTYEGPAFNTPSGFANVTLPKQDRVNVYRLATTNRHIYTQDLTELDNLVRNGWKYEGVLQDAPISGGSTPIYRLFNNSHLFTSSSKERDELVSKGWKYEGIGWHTDTKSEVTYRLYTNNHHFYTTNITEAMAISSRGATYEGIAFGSAQTEDTPVYRFFNGKTHFLTADIREAFSIVNSGWNFEGIAWQSSQQGSPVYRLRGPYHFYTSNIAEKDMLIQNGWKYEGIAWQTSQQGVHRLKGSYHFYTTSSAEKDLLTKYGWKYEGTAW